jgi:hypothetical protein
VEQRAFKKSVEVTARTRAVLARIEDPEMRRGLTRLTAEAADVITEVHALDVLARELPRTSAEEHQRIEAAWPIARDCVAAADRLLAAVKETFPEPAEAAEPDFDAAFGEPDPAGGAGAGAKAPAKPADTGGGVRAIAWAIAHEIDRMRPVLAGPVPAEDPSWRELIELQEFRGKLRNGVSELVYEAYRLHAPVTREEVIPGYRDRLDAAIDLRRAIAALGRRVLPISLRVKGAGRLDLGAAITGLAQVVGAFCASASFHELRLADRRIVAAFRKRIAHLFEAPTLGPAREVAEDLARFIEGLTAISKREMLVLHDSEAVRICRGYLDSARGPVASAHRAEAEFFLALRIAHRLEGMDTDLDSYLLYAEGWAGHRPPEGVQAAATELAGLVDAVAAHFTGAVAAPGTPGGPTAEDGGPEKL